MRTDPIVHKATTLRRLVDELCRRLPVVIEQLCLFTPDGWPSKGDDHVRGGSPSSSTESAATSDARVKAQHFYSETELAILAASAHVTYALNALSPFERVEVSGSERQRMRCTGGMGEEGHLEWGRPECHEWAEPDRNGMCMACAKRGQRWRARQRADA